MRSSCLNVKVMKYIRKDTAGGLNDKAKMEAMLEKEIMVDQDSVFALCLCNFSVDMCLL